MKLLKIDEIGLFIEDVIVDEIPKIILDGVEVDDPLYIQEPCNDGFIHPRRVDGQWVEGASQERLDGIENARIEALLTPSQEVLGKAAREIETINLLTDLGVI